LKSQYSQGGFQSQFRKGLVAKVDGKRGLANFDLPARFAVIPSDLAWKFPTVVLASGVTKVVTSRELAIDTKGLKKLMWQMGMRKLLCQRDLISRYGRGEEGKI
jgi:hypothetical protein